jgi:LETM1 and EF-hand domain-containing protein 1
LPLTLFNRCQLSCNRHASVVQTVRSMSVTLTPPITLRLRRRSTYPHPYLLTRFLSTPSTTSTSSKDEPGAHAIPPALHKTKVELRPGPIKSPTAPSGSHVEKLKLTATTNASLLQPTSPSAARTERLAETMKEDLKQAYIHGVLAHPPPDAGKVAKLWHQVKELFVGRLS